MNDKLKAIIVDDEEGARIMLAAYLEDYCPEVELVQECKNVPDAVLAINKYEPDLVFLDVEMPDYNGFELINFFKKVDFEIVFVTAYNQYAIRAFEVAAVDYLLKPLEIEHLQRAVLKVKEKLAYSTIQERLDLMTSTYGGAEINKIALPLTDGLSFVPVADIVLFEAERAYTNVFLKDGAKYLISKPMRVFEDLLKDKPFFFRPHRSHLINLHHIQSYLRRDASIQMDNKMLVPLARNRKQDFEELLKEFKLLS